MHVSCRYEAGMMPRDVKPRKASECVRWLRITVGSETGFVHSNLGRRSLRRRNGAGRHCVNGGNAQREILPTHCAPEMLKHMLQILQRMCQGRAAALHASEEKRPRRSDRGEATGEKRPGAPAGQLLGDDGGSGWTLAPGAEGAGKETADRDACPRAVWTKDQASASAYSEGVTPTCS